MTRKIVIIGMGNVGSAVAHQMIVKGLGDDYVLIDKKKDKVEADALDFQDALPNLDNHFNIKINDYSAIKDADVVISTLGNIELEKNATNDRFAEFAFTKKQAISVGKKLKACGFHGILVNISNPCDAVTSIYQQATNFPKEKVIGTGCLLDTSRMKKNVANIFQVDPRSISGYNLGEHGNSQFTAWSNIKVKGQPISSFVEQNNLNLDKIAKNIKVGGHKVLRGKGYTNYGIASAVYRLTRCILNDAHEELPVSNFNSKYQTYLSYPAVVGRNGIVDNIHLTLTKKEKNKLNNSASVIKEKSKINIKSVL